MNELKEMRAHFDTGFSTLERQRITELYMRICNKEIKNITCADCYKDAFVETFSTLQRMGSIPEEHHYKLKSGKYLHIFGSDQYLFDVTDEQAEKFLEQCPGSISDFEEYPEDWKERITKRNTRKATAAKRLARKKVEESIKEEL